MKRRAAYVSPSTQSISIAVNGGTPAKANLSNGSPNCTAPLNASPTCTFDVVAPLGNDTFAVGVYDAQNAAGNVLSTKLLTQTIVANTTNAIMLALDGVVRRITIAPGAAALAAGAIATTALVVNAFDAQSNIIVGPGPYVDLNGSALTISLAASQVQPAVIAPYTSKALCSAQKPLRPRL